MGLITAVDVDDPSTWPAAIFEWSSGYAERLRDSTEYPGDLEIPLEQEDEFRALFADYKLLAYHCTRLLDHESSVIREHGLLTLTPQIVARRLAEAHEHGFLTDAQLGHLHSKDVFSNGRVEAGEIREGQVCFVLGHAPLSEPNNGCLPLLESWGGEGLNGGPLGGQPWNLAVGQPRRVRRRADRPQHQPSHFAHLSGARQRVRRIAARPWRLLRRRIPALSRAGQRHSRNPAVR